MLYCIDKLGNTSVGQTHKTDLTYYVLKYIFWTYMEIHNGCSETAKCKVIRVEHAYNHR